MPPSGATLEGTISPKGKVKGSADFGAVKLKLEGTLSADGIAIIGTYTYKQGKKTVDKGQFFLEDDD